MPKSGPKIAPPNKIISLFHNLNFITHKQTNQKKTHTRTYAHNTLPTNTKHKTQNKTQASFVCVCVFYMCVCVFYMCFISLSCVFNSMCVYVSLCVCWLCLMLRFVNFCLGTKGRYRGPDFNPTIEGPT